ncbi:hypothetical protein KBX26_15320 [Micromonospora sp. C97]|uniref:hypothetical protein n=1 Tax=Micromonospora sp. C97 TaxID=2824883 RepID=UPI001B389EDD|nr:hypothetical protein [Micromonospora sp. C97]MBQ1031362.1 hypothetical protein [Micromonospora sp. C97]
MAMSPAVTALTTVLAVLAGSAATYLVGKLTDRDRFARELKVRWDQRRLDACLSYVSAAKLTGTVAIQIQQGRIDGASEADVAASLQQLGEAEGRRAEAFEALPLLADGDTIEAAHDLNRATWQLTEAARRGMELDEQAWHGKADNWVTALNNFHSAARAGLNVPGRFSRRDVAALVISRPERAAA